ncbi:MAG: cupin domain-containing protein [Candidatus Lokiarchaeota archaeon]|nr:cupin domain-containing protein [Candidatus Lokiarchaeota archaeon]
MFKIKIKHKDTVAPVEAVKGIHRRTMCYNDDAQICHFDMKKGSVIELHSHPAAQIGYVVKGKVEFWYQTKDSKHLVVTGDSYLIPGNVPHGAVVIEDSDVIEVFSPARKEYGNE